jgi:hypothetical protein
MGALADADGEVIRTGCREVSAHIRAPVRLVGTRVVREGLPEAATLPDQHTFIDALDLLGKERGAAGSPSPCPFESDKHIGNA